MLPVPDELTAAPPVADADAPEGSLAEKPDWLDGDTAGLEHFWHPVARLSEAPTEPAVVVDVELLGRTWQIAADAAGGWHAHSGDQSAWGVVARHRSRLARAGANRSRPCRLQSSGAPRAGTTVDSVGRRAGSEFGLLIDNQFDAGHFPFVHTTTFGTPAAAATPESDVVRAGTTVTSVMRIPIAAGNDPRALVGDRPLQQHRTMRYEYHAPLWLRLRLDYEDMGGSTVIFFAFTPVAAGRARMDIDVLFQHPDGFTDEKLDARVAFEERVIAEDLRLQRLFEDLRLPLDPSVEVSTKADRLSLQCRQVLREMLAVARRVDEPESARPYPPRPNPPRPNPPRPNPPRPNPNDAARHRDRDDPRFHLRHCERRTRSVGVGCRRPTRDPVATMKSGAVDHVRHGESRGSARRPRCRSGRVLRPVGHRSERDPRRRPRARRECTFSGCGRRSARGSRSGRRRRRAARRCDLRRTHRARVPARLRDREQPARSWCAGRRDAASGLRRRRARRRLDARRASSRRRAGRIDARQGRPLRFDLRPFLGLVGVTPAAETALDSTPPGVYGGNLDIRHLGRGSKLFLPVQTPGAGLYVSDPHYAQGNGEVALTAFEAPLRASLRVTWLDSPEARALGRARWPHPGARHRRTRSSSAWAPRSTRPCARACSARCRSCARRPARTTRRRWRSFPRRPISRSRRLSILSSASIASSGHPTFDDGFARRRARWADHRGAGRHGRSVRRAAARPRVRRGRPGRWRLQRAR